MSPRKILVSLTVLCCVVAAVSAALFIQHSHNLAQSAALQSVNRTATLLAGEFDTYLQNQAHSAELVAGLPQVIDHLQHADPSRNEAVIQLLNHTCSSLKAALCYLMDSEGIVTANNTNTSAPSMQGKDYSFRPYFTVAMDRGQASYLALGVTSGKRGIYFSNLVRSSDGQPLGVAVIKFPPQGIEQRFYISAGDSALSDRQGIVFAATEQQWLLHSLWLLSPEQQAQLRESRQFGDQPLPSLGFELLDEHLVKTPDGTQLLMGVQPLAELPGWQVLYFQQHDTVPFSIADDHGTIFSFLLLFALASVAVVWLYRLGSADIDRRMKAERELQQSEERLKQLIEISNEAILIHHQGNITDANSMAENMFGYSYDELTSHTIWELLEPNSVSKARQHYRQNYELPYEVIAKHSDGHTFPIEICAKTSYIKGKRLRVTCVRDITERKEQEQRVLHQAHYDALTGLPNRNLMYDRLHQAIKKAHRHEQKTVVMFVDLDDFKKINDTLGHSSGDQLLVTAGKRLQSSSREGDTLARYGGDEFILILEDIETLEDVEVVAEKVLRSLSGEFRIGDQSLYISGSIGIAVYPHDGEDVDQLLQKADTAMYCSKDEGRNTYHFYTPEMNQHVRERLQTEQQLRNALARDEFDLHYQPIYCAQSGTLLGAEALIRWDNPVLGSVAPDQFIPLAEQTGLILPIGEWVMREAATEAKGWLDAGLENFYISVNFSPRQFRDPELVETVETILRQTGLPATALCIEITEGLLIKNDRGTAQMLRQLKQLGIQLSLDDFGTGYSALSYLKQFPFDNLKIDRTFVRDLVEDASDRKLIQATVAMSEGLGLKVIAEGVETMDQLEFLRRSGCYAAQGYLFGKPMPKAAIAKLIAQELAQRPTGT